VSWAHLAALPADLELRELRVSDAQAIAALIDACDQTYLEWAPPDWTPPPQAESVEKWQRRLGGTERWSCGAFDADGRLAAMASARPEVDEDVGEAVPGVAHLGALFVHPSRWREGIGANLLRRAEEGMRELGYRRAVLRTPEGAPARALYESAGWSLTGERDFHESIRMTMAIYAKDLA
jgi:GNAT superfamily N-acetyltransferase